MTSSIQGTNVLTKSDSESNFPINFQPMPKRFMVWDKKYKKFFTAPMKIWQIVTHFRNRLEDLFDENGGSRYIFCQSTNFFDKDGKEVFEGSIVEDKFNETLGYVYYEPKACAWRIKFNDGEEDDGWTLENSTSNLRILGHILSNGGTI